MYIYIFSSIISLSLNIISENKKLLYFSNIIKLLFVISLMLHKKTIFFKLVLFFV